MTVSVVDYGLGNVGSVLNMLKRVGDAPARAATPDEIADADRLLLPGVGAFDAGVERLHETGLFDAIQAFAASGRPVFGICLGMQLLMDGSDEGMTAGLGLIPGRSVRFDSAGGMRVPHMGWNHVSARDGDPLVDGLTDDIRFYFVHSYHVVPADPQHTLATTDYGTVFSSMVRRDNVAGAQFHPEKSHTFGMQIMRNFATA